GGGLLWRHGRAAGHARLPPQDPALEIPHPCAAICAFAVGGADCLGSLFTGLKSGREPFWFAPIDDSSGLYACSFFASDRRDTRLTSNTAMHSTSETTQLDPSWNAGTARKPQMPLMPQMAG